MTPRSTGSARGGARWNAIGQGGEILIRYVATLALLRVLAPADMGLMSAAIVVTGILEIFTGLGTGTAIIQRESVDQRFLSSIFWFNLLLSVALALLIGGLAPLAAAAMKQPELGEVLPVLGLSFIISGLTIVQRSRLARDLDFRSIAIAALLRAVTYGVVTYVLAARGHGTWALVYGTLASQLLGTIALWVSGQWMPSLRMSYSDVRGVMAFSTNLVGSQLASYLISNLDRIIISRLIGKEALGLYTMANRLVLFPIRSITQVLMGVLVPVLSRLQNDNPRFRAHYVRSNAAIFALTAPILTGAIVAGDLLIQVLAKSAWYAAGPLIAWLAPLALLKTLLNTTGSIYVAKGATGLMFFWSVALALATTASQLLGALWGGTVGLAIGALAVNLVLLPVILRVPFDLIELRRSDYWRALRFLVLSISLATAVALGVRVLLERAGLAPLWLLLGSCGALAGVYVGLLLWRMPPAARDLLSLFHRTPLAPAQDTAEPA